MQEALNLLKDRLVKAEAKATRAEKAWESAKCEVDDLRTAYRVMQGLTGESPTSGLSIGDRQKAIVDLLQPGEAHAKPPAELFESYKLIAKEEITIDTFRTTIWRMKDHNFTDIFGIWIVKGDGGRYWKEPGSWAAREIANRVLGHQAPPVGADDDLDDDTPF